MVLIMARVLVSILIFKWIGLPMFNIDLETMLIIDDALSLLTIVAFMIVIGDVEFAVVALLCGVLYMNLQ